MSTGALTGREIVALMRHYLKEVGTDLYRDGFTTDPSTSPTLIPLLSFANQAVRIFGRAGFNVEEFTLTTTSGTVEYPLDERAGKVHSYLWEHNTGRRDLRDVTLPELQRRVPQFRNRTLYPPGSPTLVYTLGRRLGFWRPPGFTGATLRYWAETVPPAIPSGAPTTTLSGLPAIYHGGVATLGALLACVSDAENETAAVRAGQLVAFFEAEYPELKGIIDARALVATESRSQAAEEGGAGERGGDG